MPIPAAAELRRSYGNDFSHVVLSSWTNPHMLSAGDKHLSLQGNFMEPDAPEMLSLDMTAGSRAVLNTPSSILLSASAAKAFFGDASPMDKMIQLDSLEVKVGGVYKDIPYNSSFSGLAFIAPWHLYVSTPEVADAKDNWNANSFQLFAQLAPGMDMNTVSAKIKNAKLNNVSKADAARNPLLLLHPMSRWHLYTTFKNGMSTGERVQYLWMFGIIGGFVLLLACINFMNLSTARSEKRAKEVGIRKAIGSRRSQLIGQFFCESLLMTGIAFILSLLLVALALPFFNSLTDKKMTLLWGNPFFWMAGIGFSVVTGLIAGSYPAFYLSSFRPVWVLKGVFRAGRFAAMPRKVLVVLQFTVSIAMIIGTVVVFRQIQFAKNRPIGYNRNGLLIIRPYTEDLHNHFDAFRNDLIQSGAVTAVAESGSQLTKGSRRNSGFSWKAKDPSLAEEFSTFAVSAGYGVTTGWQITEGRDFREGAPADSSGILLNEAAVKYMGLQHPVGEIVSWNDKRYTVLGVVKNMVMESPYEPVNQTIFYMLPSTGFMNIRINPTVSASEAISKIEAVYKKYAQASPFNYSFAEEAYGQKFGDEERIGKLSSVFSALAIFISCLGLFALASFVAEQRTKEMGVRKVLGASVFTLWHLLSKDFAALVLIALLIAAPIAYYCMHSWLQHYTYRAEMVWWIFAATGISALLVTLLTISFQTIRVALANPVKSLRAE